ncbi:MAG: hypothetical protein K9M84_02335 [Spirochaetia bacterium]|nr:hypothetical protein [Spirochaetia bacterium]MCF7940426.1 hypothetical protein [Spirochaetia bacterium]
MFIDISAQIGALTPAEQNRLFKKIATFLSVRELNAVMEDVAQGIPLLRSHQRLGIFHRYTADILRCLEATGEAHSSSI